MPFYKKQDGQLVSGEFIDGQGYTLSEASKDEHTYPVDGWYWFPDLDSALVGIATTLPTGTVTMRQAELALLSAGLLDDIEALIPTLPRADQISWKRATTVERSNPLVAYVQQANNLTDAQIDDLFTEAAKL